MPRIDISETDKEIEITAELPGLERKDVDISLEDDVLTIRGEKVDLSDLRASLLNVIAQDDHITPPCQSARLLEKVGSTDKQELRVPGGHIGVMAGSAASKSTWPKVEAWIAAHSD